MENISRADQSTITILTIAAFCSMAALRIADPLLPVIAAEFDIGTGGASGVVSAFAIAYGVSQFLIGPMADRFGKLFILSLALAMSVAANIAVAMSEEFTTIVVWRAVAGATTAAIIPLSIAWIGETIAYGVRQATLARFLFGVLFGMIGGQMVGGICADIGHWRGGFLFLALFYLVCLLLLMRSGRAGRQNAPPPAHGHAMGHLANVLSVPWARTMLLTVGIEGLMLYGAVVFIPAFLHERLDIRLTAAAGIMSAMAAGGMLYAFTASRWLARLGERGLIRWGSRLLGLAFLLIILTGHWLVAGMAVFMVGLGMYMLHNTLQTMATQMVPDSRSTAVSLFACCIFLGQAVGVSMAGWVIDRHGIGSIFWLPAIGLPLLGLIFGKLVARRETQHDPRT